jgi:hypothetical protein
VLHVVSLYEGIISGQTDPESITARTVIFGAKAAPGYYMAKEIIFLINRVAAVINSDERVRGRLQVWFPPNYNVTLAQRIIPAADLSEQISLAGKEASGTGNMKLSLNGALTIGTDDGANVEIRQLVGDENFFLFGMREPEVVELQSRGYSPSSYYEQNPILRSAIDLIGGGHFTDGNRDAVGSIVGGLPGPVSLDEIGQPPRGPLRLLLLRPGDAGVHRANLEARLGPARPRLAVLGPGAAPQGPVSRLTTCGAASVHLCGLVRRLIPQARGPDAGRRSAVGTPGLRGFRGRGPRDVRPSCRTPATC